MAQSQASTSLGDEAQPPGVRFSESGALQASAETFSDPASEVKWEFNKMVQQMDHCEDELQRLRSVYSEPEFTQLYDEIMEIIGLIKQISAENCLINNSSEDVMLRLQIVRTRVEHIPHRISTDLSPVATSIMFVYSRFQRIVTCCRNVAYPGREIYPSSLSGCGSPRSETSDQTRTPPRMRSPVPNHKEGHKEEGSLLQRLSAAVRRVMGPSNNSKRHSGNYSPKGTSATTPTKKVNQQPIAQEGRPKSPSPAAPAESSAPNLPEDITTVLCRVCNRRILVGSANLHTTYCAQRSQNLEVIRQCTEKARKLQHALLQFSQDFGAHSDERWRAVLQFSNDCVAMTNRVFSIEYGSKGSYMKCEDATSHLTALISQIPSPKPVKHKPQWDQCTDLLSILKVQIRALKVGESIGLRVSDGVVQDSSNVSMRGSQPAVSIDDFELVSPVSKGAVGRVFLAKKRGTNDFVAIKVLSKSEIKQRGLTEKIMQERNILAVLAHNDHIVQFYYSFSSANNLYMVSQYMPGGDLFSRIQKRGYFSESEACVVCAELVLAVDFVHSNNIIHRDIKPDNILFDGDGHIRLTDFGLSEVAKTEQMRKFSDFHIVGSSMAMSFRRGSVMRMRASSLSSPTVESNRRSRAVSMWDPRRIEFRFKPSPGSDDSALSKDDSTVISNEAVEIECVETEQGTVRGTPDYIAPELLLGHNHSGAVDWWAVGVILYEMVVGIPPFNDDSPQLIFDNIISGKVEYPEELSEECSDLIKGLLTPNPTSRLGSGGVHEIQKHPFFTTIAWAKLKKSPSTFRVAPDTKSLVSAFAERQKYFPMNEGDVSMYADSGARDGKCESASPFAGFSFGHAENLAHLTRNDLKFLSDEE